MRSEQRRPYLDGVPSLTAEVAEAIDSERATPKQISAADRTIAALRKVIRRARERHELRTGRLIEPEHPTDPG